MCTAITATYTHCYAVRKPTENALSDPYDDLTMLKADT